MSLNDLLITNSNSEEKTLSSRQKSKTYKVFQVFELPLITDIADEMGNLTIPPVGFLQHCLSQVINRNTENAESKQHRSSDYFTSLNHAERYRIPLTMRRFNGGFTEVQYGLMSFVVLRGENVKNKVYNQRVSSINADLLSLERAAEVIYPSAYQLQHPLDLQALGKVINVPQEGFNVLRVNQELFNA